MTPGKVTKMAAYDVGKANVRLVIARPFIEHLMHSVILTVSGRETGATVRSCFKLRFVVAADGGVCLARSVRPGGHAASATLGSNVSALVEHRRAERRSHTPSTA